ATWINEVYVNSSQLYYPKGSLTGLLLDVSIRDASDNRFSLDDVMRALFTRFYKQGKGFRTADLLALFKEMGMPDADGFYQRYINGRGPLPYDSVLPKAGIVVTRRTTALPFLGVTSGATPDGQLVVQAVSPGSAAGAAGMVPGHGPGAVLRALRRAGGLRDDGGLRRRPRDRRRRRATGARGDSRRRPVARAPPRRGQHAPREARRAGERWRRSRVLAAGRRRLAVTYLTR